VFFKEQRTLKEKEKKEKKRKKTSDLPYKIALESYYCDRVLPTEH